MFDQVLNFVGAHGTDADVRGLRWISNFTGSGCRRGRERFFTKWCSAEASAGLTRPCRGRRRGGQVPAVPRVGRRLPNKPGALGRAGGAAVELGALRPVRRRASSPHRPGRRGGDHGPRRVDMRGLRRQHLLVRGRRRVLAVYGEFWRCESELL